MKKYFIILVLLISGIYSNAQQQEVPYTLADRDRIIQVEANLNGLRNEMNAKFEAVNMRFDSLDAQFDSIYWILGVVVALMLFMLGFIIWDRRTTLAPINSEIKN